MRIAAMFSGGKDSTFALHWTALTGNKIVLLITFRPRTRYSWALHRPFVELTPLQAEAMRLNHVIIDVSGEKEKELDEIKYWLNKLQKEYDFEGLVVGALLSDYQRMRFSMICDELGLKVYTPIWRKDQADYMRLLLELGFEILITSISAYGLPVHQYLGKILDRNDVETVIRLAKEYGYNPAFEGGEAETFVLYAPLFHEKVCVEFEKVVVSEYEGYLKPIAGWLC